MHRSGPPRGKQNVAKRSRRGREDVSWDQVRPCSDSISAHFRAVWLRFWLPVGAFSRGFGNYGVRLGSEKNPFSDRFCKWFQHRLPGGSTPFGGEPENNFFDIFKGNPFSNWLPQGAQRLPARRGLKTIDFRRDVSTFDDFTSHFS